MKKTILLLIFLVLIFDTYSQNKKIKIFKQEYLPISTNIFVAKYETSYGEYWTFLNSLASEKSKELYNECHIDTSELIRDYTLPYYELLKNPQTIINYPISNISYKTAIEYCKWLTNNYNNNPKRKYNKVFFRLPNVKEWELAASGGMKNDVYPWAGPFIRDKNGKFLCNFLKLSEINISYDTLSRNYIVINQGKNCLSCVNSSLCAINSYKPNYFGLFNMSGNVAEMVDEIGVAKGGSYLDSGYDVQIKSVKKYSDKAPNVGFRILMEVIKN